MNTGFEPARQNGNNQLIQRQQEMIGFLQDDRVVRQIGTALPSHVKPERFMRILQTAVLNDPDLLTADRASLLRECVAVAQLGLIIDPQLGEAYLIKDKKGRIQRRAGYRGLTKLARQSGEISTISAQCVYSQDPCSIRLGDQPSVEHEVPLDSDRGALRGVYAVARIKGEEHPQVEYMSADQIERHAKRYSDAYRNNSGPWTDPLAYDEMARKTVLRRLCKHLPQAPDLIDALSHEDRLEAAMREVSPPTPAVAAVTGPAVVAVPDDGPVDTASEPADESLGQVMQFVVDLIQKGPKPSFPDADSAVRRMIERVGQLDARADVNQLDERNAAVLGAASEKVRQQFAEARMAQLRKIGDILGDLPEQGAGQ